ncbi:MAG: hypothetical protein JWR73_580 [Tardiphaga sp.]|nr:hypothetical protein [Tardiphaga sp.]MDB5547157.1 hypothetical protein [Tardiphaga sp.]MDB5573604.1 hypothetical protein [Tardiphaga sp.]MDB5624778.1 hypothetical protein [Tardiphaga sp.]MDB5630676.1 hypothetical protein [Tardiphaga sp.]
MKRFIVAAIIVGLAGPAVAQSKPVPRYGQTDAAKSPAEIEGDRAADAAYRRSLGNVPNASGSTDPWGSIRADSPAKAAPAKRPKSGTTAN